MNNRADQIRVAVRIPKDIAKKLEKVAAFEGQPKSYFLKKGLANLIAEKLRDIKDYGIAKKAYEEFKSSKAKAVSFEKAFENVK